LIEGSIEAQSIDLTPNVWLHSSVGWSNAPVSVLNRELKQRRRRRRGRRLVKNEFLFYKRNSRMFRSVQYANGSKNLLMLNKQWQCTVPIGNAKN